MPDATPPPASLMCECSHQWAVHAESGQTANSATCHGYTGSATPGPLREPCRCTGFRGWVGPIDSRTGQPVKPLTVSTAPAAPRPLTGCIATCPPGCTERHALTAPDVVASLLANVADARAQLAEVQHGAGAWIREAVARETAGLTARLAEVTAERDKAYRERAHLVAHLAACHPSVMLTDSAEPDWPIVFVSTSAGQMSWHIAKADLELFGHVPATTEPTWDGHTTEEKYRRLAELVRTLSYLGPPEQVDAGIAEGKLERALAANQRWAEMLGDVQQAGRERDAHKLRADHYEGLWRAEHGLPPDGTDDLARDHGLAASVRAVIARYKADDVNALTAFADIMDAAGDTEDAEAQAASVLADPETMAAIAEGDRDLSAGFPQVACLCGSTRFYDQFQQANYDLTMKGEIVLSVGFYPHAKAAHGHGEGVGHDSAEKTALDELHKRKIDLADYVLVLNVGGYVGESTRSEIDYAIAHGKPVRYLEARHGS